ncbi:MAG: hypothetical protein JWO13_2943 [Acidobacteriales bacterium]|nr:hypothetical protein [Terriglobales bacterium]
MANDKQPRNSAAKKTTKAKTPVPTTSEPVSTAEATIATSRNAVIEGNATIDLDDVRKRAYELYEEGGRLEGRHEEHWHQAEAEVRNSKNGNRKHKKIA